MIHLSSALIAAVFLLSGAAQAANIQLEGMLRERGTRKPLEGVNVYCIPEGGAAIKAATDAQGHFNFKDVPEGNFKWVVNLTGYDRLEQYDEQPVGSPLPILPRELYLEKSSYLAYETTIYDKAQKRDDKTRSITRDQISKLAGASNDPIKAVQNLPGVNRASGFSSQVIIEGSSPLDTNYEIEGHDVPIIFHFGGLTTVVPPESVDRVDLLTSGFGAEYGRTTAGLVSVWLKNPSTDRLHGLGFVDIFNVGAMLEGPINDHSSFFISARQSYVGVVLKAVSAGNADFNLTVAPDFSDVTGIYQNQVTPIDDFKLVTVGSLDTLTFVLSQPVKSNPALRGTFSNLTSFFRVIPEWTHHHSNTTISRLSLGAGRDWLSLDTSTNYFHFQSWALTARGELEQHPTSHWRSIIGFDHSFYWAKVGFVFPKIYGAGGVSNPFSVSQTVASSIDQSYHDIGAYWRNEIQVGDTPLTLIPALRADYHSQTHEAFPEPRIQARYKLTDSFTLRTASGFYTIDPQPQETDSVYGNPLLKAPLAVHATIGAEKDFRGGTTRGWNLTSDVFYKHFYRIVLPSFAQVPQPDGTTAAENYNNNGHGRAFGLETQARFDFAPLSGWLTYTLSRSARWDPSTPEGVSGYDQTHNLAAVGSVELGRNWQLSTRLRFVTGNPYTPITGGTLDLDNDIYIPARGAYYSQRKDAFWQLDFRVDKKWIFDKWILSAYLDIQNVTNRSNVEEVRYSYDYQQSTQVSGLPFLPIFGLKGEF